MTVAATLTVTLENDQEKSVVEMVVKYMREYRRLHRKGELGFKISHRDGGLIGKHVEMDFVEN